MNKDTRARDQLSCTERETGPKIKWYARLLIFHQSVARTEQECVGCDGAVEGLSLWLAGLLSREKAGSEANANLTGHGSSCQASRTVQQCYANLRKMVESTEGVTAVKLTFPRLG